MSNAEPIKRVPSVADTILKQLGGNKFIVMTGAKNFSGNDKMLSMRLPSNMTFGKATHCTITLEPTDTYRIETTKTRRNKNFEYITKTVESAEMVCFDHLKSAFKRLTGLDTHL